MPEPTTAESTTGATPGANTTTSKKFAPRVAAENRFPSYDLNSCVALSKTVKERGGNVCTPEQLGGLLGYTNINGGGFVSRVAAAKMFGLIETVQGRYRTTPRAETILYPVTPDDRRAALRDAFLSVPSFHRVYDRFKGARLPEALGLQNYVRAEFGTQVGERTVLALRVLLDSADHAGFFTATRGQRTQLVEPIIGVASPDPSHSESEVTANGGGGGESPPGMEPTAYRSAAVSGPPSPAGLHPALCGLLTLLPAQAGPWPGRDAFDGAWGHTMDVLFPRSTNATSTEGGES